MRETVRNDFFLRIMTWQQKGIEEAVQYVVPVFPARRRRLPHRRKDRMLSFEMKRPLAAEPGNSSFSPHSTTRVRAAPFAEEAGASIAVSGPYGKVEEVGLMNGGGWRRRRTRGGRRKG